MNRRTVTKGVVIIVIGFLLALGGRLGTLQSLTINTAFTQPHPGEYVSVEIVLNSTSTLAVSSPASSGGIVQAADLNLVNSTNIDAYAIAYAAASAGTDVYTSLSGDYYYVAFASAQPEARIMVTPQTSPLLLAFAGLFLLGVVLIIAGIVVAVMGLDRKKHTTVTGQT
jgi:uncharacterized membrane protein